MFRSFQLWALRRCFSLEDLEWEVLTRKVVLAERSYHLRNQQSESKKQQEGTTGRTSKKSSKASGSKGRAPRGAAYVVWVGDSALGRDRNPYPRSAWSPDFVRNPTWSRGRGRLPTEASTFGVYFQSLKRVGHTGLVEKISGDFAVTIEGNTNNGGSRDGDGVYRRRRLLSTLLAKDWL